MKNIIFLSFIFLAVIIISCSDSSNPSGTGTVTPVIDPTIWQTDSLGHTLGGDTTDWCPHGNDCFRLYPAAPNPTNNITSIQFHVQKDTISLYTFGTSNSDTVFICKNWAVDAGSYLCNLRADSLGFHNVVKRFYLKSKSPCNNNPNCKNYGDIQFN